MSLHCTIDWIFYTNFYEDLQSANINTKETAYTHYQSHGISEHRMSCINVKEYMTTNDKYGKNLLSSLKPKLFLTPSTYLYQLIFNEMGSINHLVELNCGIGVLSLPIIKYLKSGQHYTGLDNRKMLVDWANNNITPHSTSCSFIYVNNNEYQHLPLEDNSVDVVYTGNLFSVYKLDDVKLILSEIYRIIKRGGKVIIPAFIISHITPNTNEISIRKTSEQPYIVNKLSQKVYGIPESWLSEISEKFHIQSIVFGKWIHSSECFTYRDVLIIKK